MTLLQPDYYNENKLYVRRQQLKKYTPKLQTWGAQQIDREIVEVADAMSKIEKVSMYDQDWHTSTKKDKNGNIDAKEKERYKLKEEELSALSCVPASYFGGKDQNLMLIDNEDDLGRSGAASSAGLDYLRSNTQSVGGDISDKLGGGVAFVKGLGQSSKNSIVVCAACGNRIKFKRKKKHKDAFMGFVCKTTHREWIFHDYLCVKLRKIKEAIKTYVFNQEKDEAGHQKIEDENALINIETSASSSNHKHRAKRRPVRRTTPRKGDHNYRGDNDKGNEATREDSGASSMRESIEYSITHGSEANDYTDEDDDRDRYGGTATNGVDDDEVYESGKGGKKGKKRDKKEKSLREKNYKKLGYIIDDAIEIPNHLAFRRYRTHVKRVLDRLAVEKRYRKSMPTYSERFSDLPDILLFCDLNEFGVAIFEFISETLRSKMRKSLWHILEWLALEMPTNVILHELKDKRHTHLLTKHELYNYDKICKATMEGSKYPIACALRLSAFMYDRAKIDLSNEKEFNDKGKQYVEVSRKLLKEIESDHLFALLIMLPTDIGHQNVIEIALKYQLTQFLEDPRIVRVFNVIWFHGYDFLDPDNSFVEPDTSIDAVFLKLRKTPGRFFFSPFGKFVISSILYLGYLGLFSYVTYLRPYDYEDIFTTENWPEILLWGCSAGYVVYEVLELIDSPKEYFNSMTNYWDIIISVNWVILAYLRFIDPPDLEYGTDGTVDYNKQRNQVATEIYMAVWAMQCVILWTRGLLQIFFVKN